jgi:hypothetical protein
MALRIDINYFANSWQHPDCRLEYFEVVMRVFLMNVAGLVAGERHPHFLADASVR